MKLLARAQAGVDHAVLDAVAGGQTLSYVGDPHRLAHVGHEPSAALAGCRPNLPGATDVWRLARSPIQVADGQHFFRRKLAGGMALEQTLRDLKNRRRYRQLTH